MLFLIITLFHVDKIIFWPTVCGYIYRTQFLDPPKWEGKKRKLFISSLLLFQRSTLFFRYT